MNAHYIWFQMLWISELSSRFVVGAFRLQIKRSKTNCWDVLASVLFWGASRLVLSVGVGRLVLSVSYKRIWEMSNRLVMEEFSLYLKH